MIYVMSDIHGEYGKYRAMLEKIHFSEEDTLYILGDAIDRGPEPVRVLQDMAMRCNVIFIKGNHEGTASYVLRRLNVEITADNAETQIDTTLMQAIMEWQQEGGDITMKKFRALPVDERLDLLDFLDDASLYEVVDIREKTYILVHSGLGNFSPAKKLRAYTFDELACMRPDYDKPAFDDPQIFIVGGHTPTLAITGKAEIYQANNHILIDCGAAFGGRLACLCLDTMEEFYVE